MSHRAIILAGGKGTRLRPFTTALPKALVPLGELPVLEVVIQQLKLHGFTHITLAVGHLAHLIEAYCGDGSRWGITIDYARENTPLGTAGPLRTIADLPENFLVMNADIVCDINYRQLMTNHEKSGAMATIATYQRTSTIDFGILEFDAADKRIHTFREKPQLHHSVSMGIYAFSKAVLEHIPGEQLFGFDHLMHALTGQKAYVRAFPFKGYWLDIGRVDDYEKAQRDFEAMAPFLLPNQTTELDTPTALPQEVTT